MPLPTQRPQDRTYMDYQRIERLDVGILHADVFDIGFGTSNSDKKRAGKLKAVYVDYTSNATPDTEDTVAHNLGWIPKGFIIVNRDKAGIAYDSGTAWTSSNIYLKCNVATVAFKLLVF